MTTTPHGERVRVLAAAARRAQVALADTIATRDDAILEAADDGFGLGAIASAAELHRTTVQQIVANAAARRGSPEKLPKLPFERR